MSFLCAELCQDRTIDRMMSGSNWPREEYMHEDGTPFNATDIKRHWKQKGKGVPPRLCALQYSENPSTH